MSGPKNPHECVVAWRATADQADEFTSRRDVAQAYRTCADDLDRVLIERLPPAPVLDHTPVELTPMALDACLLGMPPGRRWAALSRTHALVLAWSYAQPGPRAAEAWAPLLRWCERMRRAGQPYLASRGQVCGRVGPVPVTCGKRDCPVCRGAR